MATYERRPERVEAEQWFPGSDAGGRICKGEPPRIWTTWGIAHIAPGDWVVTDHLNRTDVMSPAEFEAKYRPVTP